MVKSMDVEYVGAQTVAPERILSQMSTKVGNRLSIARLDEDVKNLYTSGEVENARILSENVSGGVALTVVVQARALYGGAEFRGNTLIATSKLQKKIDLKPGQSIDESALREARQEIQELYRKKGFTESTVTYAVGAPTTAGISPVVYTINEGTQGSLREVTFVGNSAISSARLKTVMDQKEKGLLTTFRGAGQVDPETLAADVQAIEDLYRDQGFLNARVVNVARKRVDAKYVDVIISIDEGETFLVESLKINGVRNLSLEDQVFPYLKTQAGSKFSGAKLKDDLKLIGDQYGSKGYIEARVNPRFEDAGDGAVTVVLDIYEGTAYQIGQVHIEGNRKTKDHVIRRELPLEPGQVFDASRVLVTKRRLENMNYFSNVEISPLDTGYMDEKDLLVRVSEKPTGSINFGAGISSIDSVTGFLEITQSNFDIGNWKTFTGAGQRFRLNLRGGDERRDFSLSFTEPWFMGQRLALTTELFYRDLLFLSDLYEQSNLGGSISLRKSLGEFTYGSIEYRAEKIEIDSARSLTNPASIIRAEEGDFFKSSVGFQITQDTRDNLFLPRSGHKFELGYEFSGLGGDVTDNILTLSVAKHWALPMDGIFNLHGRYRLSSDGDHLFTRHYLGGANNLRGFDYREVGPRDPSSNDEVVGGKQSWNVTAEATYPIVEKIRLAAFYDVGEVSDGPTGTTDTGIHSNWGLGLRLFILGNSPVRLDYAFPIQGDNFNDEGGRFQFTMGAQW